MPFRLGRRRNDSGSTGSFSTATPPGTPREKLSFNLNGDVNPDITTEPEELEKSNNDLDDREHGNEGEEVEGTDEIEDNNNDKLEKGKNKIENTSNSIEHDHEQTTAAVTTSSTGSTEDLPETSGPDWQYDIPPDTTDDSSQSQTRRKLMLRDEEPVIYRDKYMAVSKTHLYIFNYYMPSAADKAISLTLIKNIQTDREAKITEGQFQKWYEKKKREVMC
jgi:hypothetical protein